MLQASDSVGPLENTRGSSSDSLLGGRAIPAPQKLYRLRNEELGPDTDRRLTERESSTSVSSALTSSTARLLDDHSAPLSFQWRTNELHQRIQDIEASLQGAGKELREKDAKIRELEVEVQRLRQAPGATVGDGESETNHRRRQRGRRHKSVETIQDGASSSPGCNPVPGRIDNEEVKDFASPSHSPPPYNSDHRARAHQEKSERPSRPPLPIPRRSLLIPGALSHTKGHSEVPKRQAGGAMAENLFAVLAETKEHVEVNQRHKEDMKALVTALEQERDQYQREKQRLEEDVAVLQGSVQGLVALLAEVPSLQGYLEEAGLRTGQRVFIGSSGPGFSNSSDSPPHLQCNAPRGGITTVGSTGVENGVYVGTSTAEETKNIWLSGRWLEHLQSIFLNSNPHLHSQRFREDHLEFSKTSRCKSSGDVLRSRDSRKDYWVPLDVYKLSQSFKDQYCPSLSMTDFSPFLQQLNAVWGEQLRKKLSPLKRKHQEDRQRLAMETKKVAQYEQEIRSLKLELCDFQRRTMNALSQPEVFSSTASRTSILHRGTIVKNARRRSLRPHESNSAADDVLCNVCNTVRELRRHLRLHVTSPVALQIGRQYDEIVNILLTMRCRDLEENSPASEMCVRRAEANQSTAEAASSCHYPLREEPVGSAERSHDSVQRSRCDDDHSIESQEGEEYQDQKRETLNPKMERLLCVVQHTCERVCEVGAQVDKNISAATRDLTRFLWQLRQYIQDDEEGTVSESSVHSVQRTHSSTNHERRDCHFDSGEPENGALHDRSINSDGIGLSGERDSKYRVTLLQVIKSVLDYSEEVLDEVEAASKDLHTLADTAMDEAWQSV